MKETNLFEYTRVNYAFCYGTGKGQVEYIFRCFVLVFISSYAKPLDLTLMTYEFRQII